MGYGKYEQNGDRDNWDENPKQEGGSEGEDRYRRYQSPENGGYTIPGNPDLSGGRPPQDTDGSTARTLGIVGLFVTICLCQIAGIVMGVIGYSKAKRSAQTLGYETSDAATGRVLGILNIVLGILLIVASIASIVFSGVLTALMSGEGVEASYSLFSI